MNRKPRPGEKYRHFKNRLYQIVAIARHSETEEEMVVYQALYGNYTVWVRPLSMFLEKVDREKYPEVSQEYRFLRIDEDELIEEAGTEPVLNPSEASKQTGASEEAREPETMHPLLLEFLEAESVAERLLLLQKMKGRVGQREIDSLCFCLDMQPQRGDLDLQLEHIRQYIRMQQKYDAPRLRSEE